MKEKLVILIIFGSALGIDSILIQYIFFEESSTPILHALEMFKYFTLQTNMIVFIYFVLIYLGTFKKNILFNKLLGGVVVYIAITFLVFSIFLEPNVNSQGFGFLGSLLNHYITPILVIGFISRYKDEYLFKFEDIKIWVIYPLIYLVILVVLGLTTGDYLYPFFQVEEVGILGLVLSIVSILVLFLILSFVLVKIVSKKENV